MISRTSDNATIRKILALRAAAGNPCTTCPTCVRPAGDPYRVNAPTSILQGCVDAAHVNAGTPGSAYRVWFLRAEARAIRRAELVGCLKTGRWGGYR